MHRYIGPIVFFGVALGFFGVALCAALLAAAPELAEQREQEVSAPVAVQHSSAFSSGISDEAAMVLAGTALIGIAAAVRRAS
jgi:hypothetical protein